MAAKVVETITLTQPIVVTLKPAGGEPREETITSLDLYEFKAKDLRALDGLADDAKGSQLLAMIARMTRQNVSVIDELGAADLQSLGDKVGAFLPDGRPTGATG